MHQEGTKRFITLGMGFFWGDRGKLRPVLVAWKQIRGKGLGFCSGWRLGPWFVCKSWPSYPRQRWEPVNFLISFPRAGAGKLKVIKGHTSKKSQPLHDGSFAFCDTIYTWWQNERGTRDGQLRMCGLLTAPSSPKSFVLNTSSKPHSGPAGEGPLPASLHYQIGSPGLQRWHDSPKVTQPGSRVVKTQTQVPPPDVRLLTTGLLVLSLQKHNAN